MKRTKKQLHYVDRAKIEGFILENYPANSIAKSLGVSKSTIYREIKRNRQIKDITIYKRICSNFDKCKSNDSLKCSYCKNYVEATCPKLSHFPFVCNNCTRKTHCKFRHYYYYAEFAQRHHDSIYKNSKIGIKISKEDFDVINSIISPLITENHQPLSHILKSHPEINVSERTLRNWINKGITDVRCIDMPKMPRFRPRKEYIHRIVKSSSVLYGRTYSDFKYFSKSHPELRVAQLDTVEGIKGDKKHILTIHFPSIEFQFGILLNSNSITEVNGKLFHLRSLLGDDKWKKIFPIMLADNGTEFNDLHKLECNEDGELLSRVFYCDPYRSGQKGSCERNHEYIRQFIPKKYSFESLTQEKVNEMFSNINAIIRPKFGDTPYVLAQVLLGEDFLNIIGIKKIDPTLAMLNRKIIR